MRLLAYIEQCSMQNQAVRTILSTWVIGDMVSDTILDIART